mgnify:CR=1 FL=1
MEWASVSMESYSRSWDSSAFRRPGRILVSSTLRMPICPIWVVFRTEVRISLLFFINITALSMHILAGIMHKIPR